MQPAGTDVLHALIHLRREPCDLANPVLGEVERRAVGAHQRGVLFRERVLRLGHDANKVLLGEGLQFNAYRKAPLQLGNEIARLRHVKGTGGDEEHMVRLHHPVLGLHVRAFDDRQQIALHALTRDIRATHLRSFASDLVDLVEEDDA